MRPESRVDRFIAAARTYGLGEEAARIFAIDALIDYVAEQVREAASEARTAAVVEAAVFLESEAHEYGLEGCATEALALNQSAEVLRAWLTAEAAEGAKKTFAQVASEARAQALEEAAGLAEIEAKLGRNEHVCAIVGGPPCTACMAAYALAAFAGRLRVLLRETP